MSTMMLLGLLVAAFIIWHFLPEAKPPGPTPEYRQDPRVRSDEAHWQTFIEEHCESPAEVAFLRAMINTHELRPARGSLIGEDIRLDLQVKQDRYRVDFLANEWLVVEIDGAAYHSSAEARERDGQRDRFFESLGYSVLRIPAKTVFNTPHEAVAQVDAALKVGKRVLPQPRVRSGFERLGETISSFSRAIDEVQRNTQKKAAASKAMSECTAALTAERTAIASALEIALQDLQREKTLASLSEESRRSYYEKHGRIEALLEREPRQVAPVEMPTFPLFAPSSEDPEVNDMISAAYAAMLEERRALIEQTWITLRSNPRLPSMVQAYLTAWGHGKVWGNLLLRRPSKFNLTTHEKDGAAVLGRGAVE